MGSGRSRGRLGGVVLVGAALLWVILLVAPGARAWAKTALLLPDLLDLGGPLPLVLVSGAPSRE